MMAVSYKVLQEIPLKFEIECKNGVFISFNFDLYLSIKNSGYLKDKIC